MGIYEYECPNGHVTEKMVPMAERHHTHQCDTCGLQAAPVMSATKTTFHHADRKAIKRSGR